MQAAYPVEIQGFAKANMGFLAVVEKALAEYVLFPLGISVLIIVPFSFVSSGKPTQVLPHMPESKRNFVHDVSSLPLIFY